MEAREISIVVAEDHALVRQGLRLMLSVEPRLKWRGECGDGERALELVRTLMPDVLLLDLGLPLLDGLSVMQAITAAGLPTRVLVVTARQDPQSFQAALAFGAHGYMLKTDDADALVAAIRTVADGGYHVSAELAGLMAPADVEPVEALTSRELDIASRVGSGLSSKQIGVELGISEHTVRKHRENIARKLGLRNAAELVAWVVRHRLPEA
ncbi:response regulator [Methyloversatilis thermotolerans]|uniref:response regulator n=1 Tax=Methyloversatilis thermotolerans TaxID=1346290 RepID=UPI00036A7E4D|nr:response regulator transcription factor [Methyloversatilis thermotolerans]